MHSPIKLSPDLKSQIDALGQVTYVVAPNRWHHLFIGDFKQHYPRAKFYGAPGLEKKRPDFKFDGIITENQTFPWNKHLEHKMVHGVPIFNEIVFFHPPSKTLIVTDLALHICDSHSLLTRIAFKLMGSYKKFGWAKLEKIFYVRNHSAFNQSLERILEWDIEKVLLPHGTPLTAKGKEHLRAAFF